MTAGTSTLLPVSLCAACLLGWAATFLAPLRHQPQGSWRYIGIHFLRTCFVAVAILPLLPDRPVGPFGGINVQHVGLFAFVLIAVSWTGYASSKLIGTRRGLNTTAFLGGFVSASATTVAMARLFRTRSTRPYALQAALVASIPTNLEATLVLSFIAPHLTSFIALPLLGGAAIQIFVATAARSTESTNRVELVQEVPIPRAASAVGLALLIAVAVAMAQALVHFMGSSGAILSACVAGLADAHAGAISAATLSAQGELSAPIAILAIAGSLLANAAVKCLLAGTSGGREFLAKFAPRLIIASAATALALTLSAVVA